MTTNEGDEPETRAKPRKVKAKTLGEFAEELEVEPKAIYGLSVTGEGWRDADHDRAAEGSLQATKDFEDRTGQEFEDYRSRRRTKSSGVATS